MAKTEKRRGNGVNDRLIDFSNMTCTIGGTRDSMTLGSLPRTSSCVLSNKFHLLSFFFCYYDFVP